MSENQQLLAEYVRSGSEAAFKELVHRYVDFVYSAALRLLNQDSHRAEDVTQTVFADLARLAKTLPEEVMLGGWLHRHTCFVVSKVLRGERRRQERERQVAEMDAQEDHGPANLAMIAPVLDEAIDQLGAEDRTAILLRFFERKDFKSVGAALNSNEEAARKRVDRALAKLHSLLNSRGVSLSVSALAASLGSQVIQAAPVGLAASIVTSSLTGLSMVQGTTQLIGVLTMSKAKAAIIGVVALAAVSVPLVLQYRANHILQAENETLRAQNAQELARFQAETTRLSNLLAKASTPATQSRGEEDLSREVLKLRGEVGRLRQENASVSASIKSPPSALSGLTENPEAKKVLRAQQRMGLAAIFGKFSKNASLTKEQTEQLNDLLADHVMSNIDHVMAVLKSGQSKQEVDSLLKSEEAVLNDKLKALLGPETFSQYEDYNNNLISTLTSEQFKGMLTGDKEKKDGQAKQLYELMKAETSRAVAAAGLSPDYQTVPSLNFRNFVSEAESDRSLALLSSIYDQVAAKAAGFLSPEELTKFNEFSAAAIANNKAALLLNRKMMAPGTK